MGILASAVSSVVALVLGIASAVCGKWVDKVVNWCVDLCMGVPHLVLLMLISFMLGKGVKGVTIAVALTHWPSLTRIVRAEVMQIRSSQYVQAAYKMGISKWKVAVTHIVPHVLPSYLIGLVLLFPHAIMHESSITFLGFGLPAEMPAIGVILSEAMKHLATGKWWMVEPLAKAAVAVGADGLILEVHNDPQNALCDGQQSIKPELFNNLMKDLSIIASAVGREI